jgi:hypothetical protein
MRFRIGRLAANPESRDAFVAWLGEEVVAWIEVEVSCHLRSELHAVITGLVVRDDLRGLGIGVTAVGGRSVESEFGNRNSDSAFADCQNGRTPFLPAGRISGR